MLFMRCLQTRPGRFKGLEQHVWLWCDAISTGRCAYREVPFASLRYTACVTQLSLLDVSSASVAFLQQLLYFFNFTLGNSPAVRGPLEFVQPLQPVASYELKV